MRTPSQTKRSYLAHGPNKVPKTWSFTNRIFVFSLVNERQLKPQCNNVNWRSNIWVLSKLSRQFQKKNRSTWLWALICSFLLGVTLPWQILALPMHRLKLYFKTVNEKPRFITSHHSNNSNDNVVQKISTDVCSWFLFHEKLRQHFCTILARVGWLVQNLTNHYSWSTIRITDLFTIFLHVADMEFLPGLGSSSIVSRSSLNFLNYSNTCVRDKRSFLNTSYTKNPINRITQKRNKLKKLDFFGTRPWPLKT